MASTLDGYRRVLHTIVTNGYFKRTNDVARPVRVFDHRTSQDQSALMLPLSDFKKDTYKYFSQLNQVFKSILETENSMNIPVEGMVYIRYEDVHESLVNKTNDVIQRNVRKRIVFVLDLHEHFDCVILQWQFHTFLTMHVLQNVQTTENVHVFLGNAEGLAHIDTKDTIFVLIEDFPSDRMHDWLDRIPGTHLILAYSDTQNLSIKQIPKISDGVRNLSALMPDRKVSSYIIAYREEKGCADMQKLFVINLFMIKDVGPSLYDFFKYPVNDDGLGLMYHNARIRNDATLTVNRFDEEFEHKTQPEERGGQGYVYTEGMYMTKVVQGELPTRVFEVYKILKKLDSPYIIKFAHINSYRNAYVIKEMEKGTASLENLLERGDAYTRETRYRVFQNIASALLHLDYIKLSHSDVKPANIVLHGNVYKLIDFDHCSTHFMPALSAWSDSRPEHAKTSDFYSLASVIAVDLVVPHDAYHIRHSTPNRHIHMVHRVQLPHVHFILQAISNTGCCNTFDRTEILKMTASLLKNHDRMLVF